MQKTVRKDVVAGADVAKGELVVRLSVDRRLYRFGNHAKGIREAIRLFRKVGVTLVICEQTGRYESEFLKALWQADITLHCAHPKAIHNFAKARKANGKSDPIDAETILEYGLRMDVEPTVRPSEALWELKELTARRDDLNAMLVQEKNRLKAPGVSHSFKQSVRKHIRFLEHALKQNAADIFALVQASQELKEPIERLDMEHGVALVTAACVYASMPELGTLDRQTAASLCGLAPHLRESGTYKGKRKISGGRKVARSALYMVALTVIRNKSHVLHSLYTRLKKAGKHSSVALTAVMRKLIVRFNSVLKELRAQKIAEMTLTA